MVGLTIPFGGNRHAAETKPRIDLRFQAAEIGAPSTNLRTVDSYFLDRRDVRQVELSLTMEEQPRFMMNGRSMTYGPTLYADQDGDEGAKEEGEEPKKERTTGQKILRGAAFAGAAVAVVGVAFVSWFAIELSNCDGACGE